jgi:hypothetical protein
LDDVSTHFETPEYAERIIAETHSNGENILLYLTNGANEDFTSGGEKTNKAITTLGDGIISKYFNIYTKIPPPDNIIKNIYSKMVKEEQERQQILDSPVGTVIISKPEEPKTYKTITYEKVFHIKGYDFDNSTQKEWKKNRCDDDNANEKSDEYKDLVTNYYYTVVNETFQSIQFDNTSNYIVLHLAEIPGNIFLGNSNIVCECMVRGINYAITDVGYMLKCNVYIVLPTKCKLLQVPIKSLDGKCFMENIEKPFFGAGVIVVEKNSGNPLVVLFTDDKYNSLNTLNFFNNAGGKYKKTHKNLMDTAILEAKNVSLFLINITNKSVLSNAYYNDVEDHNKLFRTYFICLGDDVVNTKDFNSNISQNVQIIHDTSSTFAKFKVSDFENSDFENSTSLNVQGIDGKTYMIDYVTFKAIKKMIEDKKIDKITSEIKHHEQKEVQLSTVVGYTDEASKDKIVITNYISK